MPTPSNPGSFPAQEWSGVEFPDPEGDLSYLEKVTWAGRAASKRCLSALRAGDLIHFDHFDFTLAVYDHVRQVWVQQRPS